MPILVELVSSLDSIAGSDLSGASPTIYARRPWSSESAAVVLYGEHSVEPATAPGFTYLLEVELAKEVIEVWSAWRDGRTPTLIEAVTAVIWYAEHDAYEPLDEIDKVQANLLLHLSDLVRLLDIHAENHWAPWLAERRDRVARGDRHAVRQLRESFGGMGSLNDLQIDPVNGHRIRVADVDKVNGRLRELRTKVWTHVQALLGMGDDSWRESSPVVRMRPSETGEHEQALHFCYRQEW